MFEAIDTDNSGSITVNELEAALTQIDPNSDRAKSLFDGIDQVRHCGDTRRGVGPASGSVSGSAPSLSFLFSLVTTLSAGHCSKYGPNGPIRDPP